MIRIFLIVFLILYIISIYNYLIFHFCMEMFTITVSWCAFQLAWTSRDMFKNGFFLALGQSYLFFGLIEILHTLSYKGMGLFLRYDANLPTQLWIAAGYFSSISFLIASLFVTRTYHAYKGMIIYAIVTTLILVTVFSGFFPDCFLEGAGLTPFKKISEIIICIIYGFSIIRVFIKKTHFSLFVHKMLLTSLIFDIAARISFIFYISVYGFSNMVGHFFQLISFYFIYQAFVETGITRPMDLLSRQLEHEEKLEEESKQEFMNLFENMLEAMAYHKIVTNDQNEPVDYVFLNVNERYEQYIGLDREKLINRGLSAVLPDVYSQSKAWINVFGKVAQDKKPLSLEQFSERHNRWFEISIFSPKKGYFATILSDISTQKQKEFDLQKKHSRLEDSVKESIQEIHNKNIELEQGIHDLNKLSVFFSQKLAEPINEMFYLTTQLNENVPSSLDEKQIIWLKHLYRSSDRIKSQISSIVEYFNMGHLKFDRTTVDTNMALKVVLGFIRENIEYQNVHIEFQKLPKIICNEKIIKKVFINLISNAIKYNDKKVKHIKIGYLAPDNEKQNQQSKKSPIFYIKDNGIGIPADHCETIFRFFYRLHPKDAYGGGLGAGLTLVRKMIEKYDGWILVDSDIGLGSTFYFML